MTNVSMFLWQKFLKPHKVNKSAHLTITVLTLFPEMFQGPFNHSIVKRAQEKGLVTIRFVNIRDFGLGKHKTVDDTPYGGGVGMLLRVDVVADAIQSARLPDFKP